MVALRAARHCFAMRAEHQFAPQSRTGRLASFRCSVRRCIFSARAVAETLPSCSASTRWMCSHSRRSTDAGARSTSIALLPPWRPSAATTSSAVARFAQVVDRTEFDRFDGGRDARVTGQHDDARRRFDFVQPLDQLQSGRAGHFRDRRRRTPEDPRPPGRMRRRRRRRPPPRSRGGAARATARRGIPRRRPREAASDRRRPRVARARTSRRRTRVCTQRQLHPHPRAAAGAIDDVHGAAEPFDGCIREHQPDAHPLGRAVRRLRFERRCVANVEAVAAVADVEHQVVVGAARRAFHGTRRCVGCVVQQIEHRLPQRLVGRDVG